MAGSANPSDERSADDRALAAWAAALADAIDASLGGWVERSVATIARQWEPGLEERLRPAAEAAGQAAVADVGGRVRTLLTLDVDDQPGSPLAVLRGGVAYPTAVLRAAGVAEVRRDEFEERAFPDDVYGLSPAAFADIGPAVHEAGMAWGAAKAHTVLARRRRDGQR